LPQKIQKILSFLIAAFFTIHSLNAQNIDYHLQHFNYSIGIKPNNIVSVTADGKGYLWILYQKQVQRFDGKQMETFALSEASTAMVCDSNGTIWISTQKSVSYFDNNTNQLKKVNLSNLERNKKISYLKVFVLPNYNITIASDIGFFYYDQATDKFVFLQSNLETKSSYSINSVKQFGNCIFTINGNYILRYNVFSKLIDTLQSANISALFPISENQVLITSWGSESYWLNYANKTVTAATHPDDFNNISHSFNVRSTAQINNQRILIAANQGIFEYNPYNRVFKKLRFYIDGRQVSTKGFANFIYYDDGYVWMATIDGIARFNVNDQSIGHLRIRQIHDTIPATIDNVRRMIEDEKGNIWIWICVLAANGK
jgi:ligand-binding sensor domain-containing protein